MRAKKKWGQHFLIDQSVIDRMLDNAQVKKTDHILEVGPGQGVLTRVLLPLVGRLTAVEIDIDMASILNPIFAKAPHGYLYFQDVLMEPMDHWRLDQPYRIISNLPYGISTPFLFMCLENRDHIKDLHLLLQEDLIDRVVAKPNTKAYGQLSVLLQLYFDVEKLFVVPPESFRPPPKVDSAVVVLVPKNNVPEDSMEILNSLVKTAFNQRRKMLRKSLKEWKIESHWLDLSRRPESLSIKEWQRLASDLLQQHR